MRGLEQFLLGFGTTRECRSLDADIKLHKLQTMIPQVVPKKYEQLPMEFITFQGAYIRSMTLIVLEGIVAQHLDNITQGLNSVKVKWTHQALTNIFMELLLTSED